MENQNITFYAGYCIKYNGDLDELAENKEEVNNININ